MASMMLGARDARNGAGISHMRVDSLHFDDEDGPCTDSYAREVLFQGDLEGSGADGLLKSPLVGVERLRGRPSQPEWAEPSRSFRGAYVPYCWVLDKELRQLKDAVRVMYGHTATSNNRWVCP